MIDQNNRTIWNITNFLWNSNPYIWSDIEILIDIISGAGSPLSNYNNLGKKKKRRIIKLICNINGVEYIEEKYNELDKKVTVRDIEMLAEDVSKYVKIDVYV